MGQVVAFRSATDVSSRVSRKKMPRRPLNAARRSREYLTPDEVDAVIVAAGTVGRHRHRDATLILIMYRHGLRVSEAIDVQWDQVDMVGGKLHVNRLKNGNDSVHYLDQDEMEALKRLESGEGGSHVFMTERGGPLTRSAVSKIVERAGREAGLRLPVHPHMLRHACGFALANKGCDTRLIQDYLGHKSITHTVRYTQLVAERFRDLWRS